MILNETVVGICQALDDEFEGAYKIYTEDVPMDGNHVFRIVRDTNTRSNDMGCRYWQTMGYDVMFFLEDEDTQEYADDIIERTMAALEDITVSGALVHSYAANSNEVDKVIHVQVSYQIYLRKLLDKDPNMEVLNQTEYVRGEHRHE